MKWRNLEEFSEGTWNCNGIIVGGRRGGGGDLEEGILDRYRRAQSCGFRPVP